MHVQRAHVGLPVRAISSRARACGVFETCRPRRYASANALEDGPLFAVWAEKRRHVIALPMAKFVMGCMCYMVSVILTSYRDLRSNNTLRGIALLIGVMSVSMVWAAFFVIRYSIKTTKVPTAQINPTEESKDGSVAESEPSKAWQENN